jgi:hypothetical protein
MSDLRQREIEYRSRAYLDGARGENCKLRFVGVCNHNPETVVACHVTDTNFGLARKAHDFSIIDGCANCHRYLDHGWVGKISLTIRLQHIVRGLQETLLSRIERGIVTVKLDAPKPFSDRPVKARKPKNERQPIPGRKLESRSTFPTGRKLPSRPLQRKGDTI